jgi:hypothetical protein
VAGTFYSLGYFALIFQRSAGKAAGQDLSLFVEKLFKEFGILVVYKFDTALFETAIFLFLGVHRGRNQITDF